MKKLAYILVGGIAVVGIGAYFYLKNKSKKDVLSNIGLGTTKPSSTTATTPVVKPTNISQTELTSVPSTAVNIPVISSTGTLSGTVSSQNTPIVNPDLQTINPNYTVNLNKANIAFEELKNLRTSWKSSQSKVKAGACASVANGACQRYYTSTDVYVMNKSWEAKTKAKEAQIFALGFKVVGDKLFLI